MQPIIFLAIIAVAAGTLGVGFLTNPIDMTMVQLVGTGMTDLASPVDKVLVDFKIEKIETLGFNNIPAFKNIIAECLVQNAMPGTGAPVLYTKGDTVICKLTDELNNVVAEGRNVVPNEWINKVIVKIGQPEGLPNNVKNVHDVIIVVKGPTQIMTD